jgi:hypothetical protein
MHTCTSTGKLCQEFGPSCHIVYRALRKDALTRFEDTNCYAGSHAVSTAGWWLITHELVLA